ncbi:hypothetical protein CF70_001105 [Cupriavidus sp. SK-3]|nr:hypothetical protein CF70_001105 [Cupriavidus sp. SK-3]
MGVAHQHGGRFLRVRREGQQGAVAPCQSVVVIRAMAGRPADQHGVADLLATVAGQRRERPLRCRTERSGAAGHHGTREDEQVRGRRAQRAGARQCIEVPWRPGLFVAIAGRERLGLRPRELERAAHAQRSGDVLAHKHIPRLAVPVGKQLPEQAHPQIAVRRAAGWRVFQRQPGKTGKQLPAVMLGERVFGPVAGKILRLAGQTGAVRHELAQRDGGGLRLQRCLALQKFAEVVIQRQVAPLDGLREQQAREQLADGADLEQRQCIRIAALHDLTGRSHATTLYGVAILFVPPDAHRHGAGLILEHGRCDFGGRRCEGERGRDRR